MQLKGGPVCPALARRAVAALEFALVAPVIAIMIFGVFDISKALILRQEVINAAHSISLIASFKAVQPNGTTALSVADVQAVESDIFAEIPWLRSGVEHGNTSVTLSGLEFTANPADKGCVVYVSCTSDWTPKVAWSVPYQPQGVSNPIAPYYGVTFEPLTRPCGVVKNVLNITSQQTVPINYSNFLTTIRTNGITYPDPIVVADVSYTYTFASFPLGLLAGKQIVFVASAYWPVRVIPFNANANPDDQVGSGQLTTYDLANTDTSTGAHCPGLP
jgi:Flp pilus assembly protein TadG